MLLVLYLKCCWIVYYLSNSMSACRFYVLNAHQMVHFPSKYSANILLYAYLCGFYVITNWWTTISSEMLWRGTVKGRDGNSWKFRAFGISIRLVTFLKCTGERKKQLCVHTSCYSVKMSVNILFSANHTKFHTFWLIMVILVCHSSLQIMFEWQMEGLALYHCFQSLVSV